MDRKVRKIEKLADGGLLVELTDGTTTRYATANALPADLAAGLLARLDNADGGGQAQGGQGDADAARDAYRRRLEQASQGEPSADPGAGLTGSAAYRARLEGAWQQKPAKRREHPKCWKGA